jgi:F-type H+-transporting ATPase subunit gamma
MASIRLIRRRIRSTQNIAQITKAMQMVAAAKMKRAQSLALSGRPYTDKIAEMTKQFTVRLNPEAHPLLKKNHQGKPVIVIISTNKGLCGGLNTNLFRYLSRILNKEEFSQCNFVTVGKKGESFIVRTNRQLIADFSDIVPFSQYIPAITAFITERYIKGEFREVNLAYHNFISALKQEPTLKKILPVADIGYSINSLDKPLPNLEFLVEPNISTILDALIVNYLENQIRDSIREAEASEHSARMIAMKNATDNATELTRLLTLEYNQIRQEKITYEIADMVTARLAVE